MKHTCNRCYSTDTHRNLVSLKAFHRQSLAAQRPSFRKGRPVQVTNVASLERATTSTLGSNIREQFPVLHQEVNGRPLIYLDNAATSQKPRQVLDSERRYYEQCNSNVHRGVHHLSTQATAAYEATRQKVAEFINAKTVNEIVYTKGATEGINLVAYSWALNNLQPGDEILMSVAEHHSNLVPWHMVARKTGAVVRHFELTKGTQEPDVQDFKAKLSPKTKLVTTVHVSNTLGFVSPVAQLVEAAHKVGAKVLLDCCQSVPHMPVDVQAIGADWIVFSSHKMMGPTGCGVLYGRYAVLESMDPFMYGGEMIDQVTLETSTYAPPPSRFEAGTPGIAQVVALGAAVDYLNGLGMQNVHEYEQQIGKYLYDRLQKVEGVTIYGPPPSAGRAALCAFNVDGLHATDVSTLLDQSGVAVRSGHHCTQPLHRYLGISASARASAYVYNTEDEVNDFIAVLDDSIKFFRDMGL